MKVIFSPGPSYSNPEVRKYAGWVGILDLYKQGLEELGFEVFTPVVPPELIDQASTVSKIVPTVGAVTMTSDTCSVSLGVSPL